MLISNQYLTNLTDFVSFIKAIVNIHVYTCFISTFVFLLKLHNPYNIFPCENKECRIVCFCILVCLQVVLCMCDKAVKDWGCSTGFGCQRNEKCHVRQNKSDTHTSD